ncbi:hypothetical protein [Lentzea aerocolonigenes]|uniref:hypothetical protein n=1 Tax=Lentzea aerocolonigenes TaxID=68170 RepID=UPI000A65EAE6|nr:hypothetical protein [Lentzea aerocolonigenes]MCP2248609.1 hypothetical protein [Lentzea aerocolonigenes]
MLAALGLLLLGLMLVERSHDFVPGLIGGKAAQPSRQSSAVHSRPVVTALALVGS